jgi:hypothetical protein
VVCWGWQAVSLSFPQILTFTLNWFICLIHWSAKTILSTRVTGQTAFGLAHVAAAIKQTLQGWLLR